MMEREWVWFARFGTHHRAGVDDQHGVLDYAWAGSGEEAGERRHAVIQELGEAFGIFPNAYHRLEADLPLAVCVRDDGRCSG